MEFKVPTYYLHPSYLLADGPAQTVIDPGDFTEVGVRGEVTGAQIEACLTSVNEAQRGWAAMDPKTRARYLHEVADRIDRADLDTCAVLMTREMGKPWVEAMGELANCASVFRYYAEMARDEAGKVAGSTQAGSFQYARYEPVGVTVHIMPFNFPILLMCWTVAASLAAGNACVIKPAPATTLCTLAFLRVFDPLPENLIACLTGGTAVAQALIAAPQTHAIAFTGSAQAARAVASQAGALLKPAVIEAGGSDAFIVSRHAPIDVAAAGAVTAAFHLSGQVCTSAERFFVVDEVHDRFVEAMAERTRKLRIGHGLGRTEIGPLVGEAARAKVERLVRDACAKGATAVTGGRVPPGLATGWYYEPTILTGVTQAMDLMHEEIFGPVAAIVRVKDFDEALRMANDSPFGLGASVFTTDLAEAMQATERLESGMVWVNNPLIDNDALPFGGWKASGMGRELSRQGLDAFRRAKMVVLDHQPAIQSWWYPYPDGWFRGAGHR